MEFMCARASTMWSVKRGSGGPGRRRDVRMWITSEWSHRTSIPVAGNPLDVADLRRVYVPPVVSPDRAPGFARHSRARARARPALILAALGVAVLLLSPSFVFAAATR